MDRRSPIRRASVLAALFLTGSFLLGDMVGYSKVLDIRAESVLLVAEHHHDWSTATRDARFKMISTTKDPFAAENTYSFLRVVDKASGKERFRKPVPALTFLWISPDSRYVVGLSNVMLWNPYQLVVFDGSGARLLEQDMTNDARPGVSRSVTNWIFWFKEPLPTIRIAESRGSVVLSIEDPLGKLREFRFQARV
jgi:hypothetical protein